MAKHFRWFAAATRGLAVYAAVGIDPGSTATRYSSVPSRVSPVAKEKGKHPFRTPPSLRVISTNPSPDYLGSHTVVRLHQRVAARRHPTHGPYRSWPVGRAKPSAAKDRTDLQWRSDVPGIRGHGRANTLCRSCGPRRLPAPPRSSLLYPISDCLSLFVFFCGDAYFGVANLGIFLATMLFNGLHSFWETICPGSIPLACGALAKVSRLT